MIRAVVVCPGRGSYGRAQLGSLPAHDPIIAALDRVRAARGRPTVTELDRAPTYSPRLHVAGEHASLLTFAASVVDVAALDRAAVDVVGVTGNSMGFYTALHVAGALDLAGAARLVDTLGGYQADNVLGAQLVYPTVDERWRADPALRGAVDVALAQPGVFLSIQLGGAVVLGVDATGLERARGVLPVLERGGLSYPLQLPLHSAFHTPLMAATRARAPLDLADLPLTTPALTLIGGDGTVHRPWGPTPGAPRPPRGSPSRAGSRPRSASSAPTPSSCPAPATTSAARSRRS